MARCKEIKQKAQPRGKEIKQGGNPEYYYHQKPVWAFLNSDECNWAFTEARIKDRIWTVIFPKLKEWESQTWNEILVKSNKQNHSIDVTSLNTAAQKRLEEMKIEAESLVSLRLSGKVRLYGYMTGHVFNILWFDDTHGDNSTCVCRSKKKHT